MSKSSDPSKARSDKVARALPQNWERRPYTLVTEMKEIMRTLVDEGRSIDTGSRDGQADMWLMIDGVEYYVTVQLSKRQLQSEGKAA